jgi:hypothetical protein
MGSPAAACCSMTIEPSELTIPIVRVPWIPPAGGWAR